MNGPPRQHVELDGCTVPYQRSGTGPPLLFLHGEGDRWSWEPWMARLAERFDLIVPDHPGFGGTPSPPWLDDVHDLAYFYLDFLAALGLERVHLAGHSLGGWIAVELAIRDVHRLASLTLVASAGLRVVGVPKLDPFFNPPDEVVRAQYADRRLADAALATVLDPAQADVQLANRFAEARLMWQPRHDLRLPKWLHRIAVPTLVLWGDADRVIPPAYAAEFARLIPGAQRVTIPGCGHLPQREAPDAFVAALTAFLTTGAAA